jgi:hypothetical protein
MLMTQVMPLFARSYAIKDDHFTHKVNQPFLSFPLVPSVLHELSYIVIPYSIHPGRTRRDIITL